MALGEILCTDCGTIFLRGTYHDCYDTRTVQEILNDYEDEIRSCSECGGNVNGNPV